MNVSPLDIFIVLFSAYGLAMGFRRGVVIVALEYVQIALSIFLAAIIYNRVGDLIRKPLGGSNALAHVAAFVGLFLIFDIIAMALSLRLIKRYGPTFFEVRPKLIAQVLGSALNGVKLLACAAAAIVLIQALPFSGTDQRALFYSPTIKAILSRDDPMANVLHGILGHNLDHGLGLLTIAVDAESDKMMSLGFSTQGTVDPQDEDRMLVFVNTERVQNGLEPLSLNVEAREVARNYAKDLFARGYFSHQSLEGTTPFDRLAQGNVPFGFAGENLALAPDVQAAHQGLMQSPPHRANILSPHYRTLGIGIMKSPDHGIMVVQDFTD